MQNGCISRRIADQLSPHHDSQFSSFSTEVFSAANQAIRLCGFITLTYP